MLPYDFVDKLQQLSRLQALNQTDDSDLTENQDILDRYRSQPDTTFSDLYQPRDRVSRMYQQSLMNIPQRTPATRTSRVLGALQALGGASSPAGMYEGQPIGFRFDPTKSREIYDQATNDKYYEKLGDWRLRNEALKSGTAEEDKYNINQRLMSSSIINQQLNRDKLAALEKDREEKNRLTQQARDRQDKDAETRRQNSIINKWRAEHPNHKIMVVGDKLVAVDPQTNKTEYLRDENGYGIDSGKLDETTKYVIALQNQLAEIHARGGEERQNIGARGTEARKTDEQKAEEIAKRQKANIGQRGEEARRTQAARPATNAAGNSEVTTEKRDAKGNLIESSTRRTTRGNNLGGQPAPTGTVSNQPTQQQRVKVRAPNGTMGTVTVEDSKKLPAGWTIVQ